MAAGEASPGPDRDDVAAVRDRSAALNASSQRTDRDVSERALTLLQDQVYRDFAGALHRLQRNLHPREIGVNDVPGELRREFVSPSGRFLLQIHPAVDIWDRHGAERFVADLRSVDPEVTGTPIITFEAINYMERAYKEGTVYAFLVVALLSALLIRRFREAALGLVPLVLGTLWTAGLMQLFRLPFNFGNVFGLPLIIGTGAEFGLNVVLRYLEGREYGGPLIARRTPTAGLVNRPTPTRGLCRLMGAGPPRALRRR